MIPKCLKNLFSFIMGYDKAIREQMKTESGVYLILIHSALFYAVFGTVYR